jgi:hypothetical protein
VVLDAKTKTPVAAAAPSVATVVDAKSNSRNDVKSNATSTSQPVISCFQACDGGVPARIIRGPGIYFFGIIDILQEYNTGKKMERCFKIFCRCKNRDGISVVPPEAYGARFLKAMQEVSQPLQSTTARKPRVSSAAAAAASSDAKHVSVDGNDGSGEFEGRSHASASLSRHSRQVVSRIDDKIKVTISEDHFDDNDNDDHFEGDADAVSDDDDSSAASATAAAAAADADGDDEEVRKTSVVALMSLPSRSSSSAIATVDMTAAVPPPPPADDDDDGSEVLMHVEFDEGALDASLDDEEEEEQ